MGKRPPDEVLSGTLQAIIKKMRRGERARDKKWGKVKYYFYNHDEAEFYACRVRGQRVTHHLVGACL